MVDACGVFDPENEKGNFERKCKNIKNCRKLQKYPMHTVFLILKLKNEIYTPPLCFGGVLVHIFLALHIIFHPHPP